MTGVNRATIVGRLGNDPEVKTTPSGQQVANFSVATSESWKGGDGGRQERTEWHRIVVWGKLAELCGKYLTKGRQVYLEGRIQTRSWEDKQGQKRYTTEIVAREVQFLSSANSAQHTSSHSAEDSAGASSAQPSNHQFGSESSFDSTEELPF